MSEEKREYKKSDPSAGGPGGARKVFMRHRRSNPFEGKDPTSIDYKDVRMLEKFVTERGRIVPRRVSSTSAQHQRELALAIKRARFLALMPYVRQ